MTGPLDTVDPDGLLEYSVVYTDRTLNHMSTRFQVVMTDLSRMLREVYSAEAALVVPGSGTFGMEAVARQFAAGQSALIVRNGLFSYRWSQILEAGKITQPGGVTVLEAQQTADELQAPWAPPPVDLVTADIEKEKPGVVFAAHVETASGIILPDDYLRAVATATHAVGGLFVLDCIASGAAWVDMRDIGVDLLISAPQKGWSSAAGLAIVCLSAAAQGRLEETESSSFSLDLRKWRQVMQAYEDGKHLYYATLPTMALQELRDAMAETRSVGWDATSESQFELGRAVRGLLAARGFPSVAAAGFEAPGVVVSYTTDPDVQSGRKFGEQGLQVAAGVPLMCGERPDFRTFRIGLFGLDKLADVEGTVKRLADALDNMGQKA